MLCSQLSVHPVEVRSLSKLIMDLSTNADFLSGAFQLVTGERIVAIGQDNGGSTGSFDLDCLHKRSLQWRGGGGDITPGPAAASLTSSSSLSDGDEDGIMEISVETLLAGEGTRETIKINPSVTLEELKSRFQAMEGAEILP